jgi:hypothetical protein
MEIHLAAKTIHRERVQKWASSNEGNFPTFEDSLRLASSDVAILCRALGSLVAITPEDLTHAYSALKRDTR